VEAQLDDFDMTQLVNVWWALGKLSINPGRQVNRRFFDRIAGVLVDLTPQVPPCRASLMDVHQRF
jgi:hypothetical protein